METANLFRLLGDDDAEDPSLLIAAQQQKIEPKKAVAPSPKTAAGGSKAAAHTEAQAKLPSKPLPPAQAVSLAVFSGLVGCVMVALVDAVLISWLHDWARRFSLVVARLGEKDCMTLCWAALLLLLGWRWDQLFIWSQ